MENKNAKKNKFVDFIKENKGFQKLCVIILSIALIFILLLSSFSFTDSSKNSDSTVETYVNNLEKKLEFLSTEWLIK